MDTVRRDLETVISRKQHKLKRVRLDGTNENCDIILSTLYAVMISDTEIYTGEFYRTALGWRFRGKKADKSDEQVEAMLSCFCGVYRIILF